MNSYLYCYELYTINSVFLHLSSLKYHKSTKLNEVILSGRIPFSKLTLLLAAGYWTVNAPFSDLLLWHSIIFEILASHFSFISDADGNAFSNFSEKNQVMYVTIFFIHRSIHVCNILVHLGNDSFFSVLGAHISRNNLDLESCIHKKEEKAFSFCIQWEEFKETGWFVASFIYPCFLCVVVLYVMFYVILAQQTEYWMKTNGYVQITILFH